MGLFSVSADLEAGRVRARISGFLDQNAVARFSLQEQAAALAVVKRHGAFDLIIQTPGGMAQAASTLTAFKNLVRKSPLKARRIVVISTSSLLRMQLRRVLAADGIGIVESNAEAEEWLARPELVPGR